MPTYTNGEVPPGLLVTFNSGYNERDGNWTHSLPPATYARLLALQARALNRTGRRLRPGPGWTCYRPKFAQVILKNWYTAHGQPNMSATPGTSSHGLFWEGRQCAAIDLGNWDEVYAGFGGRAVFYDDCRAVGLTPGLIHPSRNRTYPDEPWHVNDLNCWSAVPAFAGVVLPFNPQSPSEEDDMFSDNDRRALDEGRNAAKAAEAHAAEARRMLGVLLGYEQPANETEHKALDKLWAAGEARRMLGVLLGWNDPATVEEGAALGALRAAPAPAAGTPTLTAAEVADELTKRLAE